MIADLDKLIELQQTDTNLRRLKKSLETAETRRAEIEQEFEQHAFSIREIQGKRDTLQAKRADLENLQARKRDRFELFSPLFRTYIRHRRNGERTWRN